MLPFSKLFCTNISGNSSEIHSVKGKQEVDFIYHQDGKAMLVNVAHHISDPQTLKRETEGLSEAMTRLAVDESVIVIGEGEQSEINIEKQRIRIIPAWQWLIDPQTQR